jgi:hypothetical protein
VTPPSQGAHSDRVPFFLPDQKHFLFVEQFIRTSTALHASFDILVGSAEVWQQGAGGGDPSQSTALGKAEVP